jgi:hypothetical protein
LTVRFLDSATGRSWSLADGPDPKAAERASPTRQSSPKHI